MLLRILTVTLFAGCCNVAFGTAGPGLNVGHFQSEHFVFDTVAGGGGYGDKGGGRGIAAVRAPLVTMVSPNFIQMSQIPIVQQRQLLTQVQSKPLIVAQAPAQRQIVTLGAVPLVGPALAPVQNFGPVGGQAVKLAQSSGPAFAPVQEVGQVGANVEKVAQAAGPAFAPVQAVRQVIGNVEKVAQAAGPAFEPIQGVGQVGGKVVNVDQIADPAFGPIQGIGQVGGKVLNVAQAAGPAFGPIQGIGQVGGNVVNVAQVAGPDFGPIQGIGQVGGKVLNVAQEAGPAFGPIQGVGQVGGKVQNVAAGPVIAHVQATGAIGGPRFASVGGQIDDIGGAAFTPESFKDGQRGLFVGTSGIMQAAPIKGGNIGMINFGTRPIGMTLPLRRNVIANTPLVNLAQVPMVPQMIAVPQSEQLAATKPFLSKGGAPLLRPIMAQANAAFIPNILQRKGNIQTVNVRPISPKQNVRILPRVVATNRVEKPIIAPPTIIQRQPVDGGTFVVNAPPININPQNPKIAPARTVETKPIDGGTVVVNAPPVQLGPNRIVAPAQTVDGGSATITQNVAALQPPPPVNVVDTTSFAVPQVSATANVVEQKPIGQQQFFTGSVPGVTAEPGLIPLISNPSFQFQNNLQPFMTQRQFVGAVQGGVAPSQLGGVGGASVVFPQGVQGLSRFNNIEGRFESGLNNDDSAGLNGGFVRPISGVNGINGIQQFPGIIGGAVDRSFDNRIDDLGLSVNDGSFRGEGLLDQNRLIVDPSNTVGPVNGQFSANVAPVSFNPLSVSGAGIGAGTFNDGRTDFIGHSGIANSVGPIGAVNTGPVLDSNGVENGMDNFIPEAFAFEDKTGGVVRTSIKKTTSPDVPAEKMDTTKEIKIKEQEVVTGKMEPKPVVSGSETNNIEIVDMQSSVVTTNDVKLPTEDVVKADGSLDMTVVSVNTDQKGNNSNMNKDATSVNDEQNAKALLTTPAGAKS